MSIPGPNGPHSWGSGYPGWADGRRQPLREKRWPASFGHLSVQTPPSEAGTAKEVPLVRAEELVKCQGWHQVLIPRLIDSLFNWFRNNVYHLKEESSAAPYYALEGPLQRPNGAGTHEDPFVMQLPALLIPTLKADNGDGTWHVFMELPLRHSVLYQLTAAPRAMTRRWTVNGSQGPVYQYKTMCYLKETWMVIELPSWDNVQVLLQEMPSPTPSLQRVTLRMQLIARLPTTEVHPHQYSYYTYHYMFELDRHTPVPRPIAAAHFPQAR
ncbi:salivary gland secretion 1 [Rhodotorula toruloides]|uniref:Salivary gland secretion 1 n=1 Tax=Rhodotorula toruloides TaxID=5286 RepID=A0A511KR24_RHOTO|nr:salivary gland secretion 1 [Rhodotorula toruloides]